MQLYNGKAPYYNDKAKPGGPAHLGDSIFKETATLGSGYSGEVKKVQDENGHCYALKISTNKHIRFSLNELPTTGERSSILMLPEASEFEKLKKLYAAGVPVPRPHGFQIHSNADGLGNTSLLMELVRGFTLRDWLSDQPGGKPDKVSGRSIHPAATISEAVARIDVSIAIVGALLKLKRLGFFADFKPRNIMILEQCFEQQRQFSTCLVDIGGVVLYQDLSTHYFFRSGSKGDKLASMLFHPIKDRYLIETTCSYLSPEMALVIAEYDFWKGRLSNHFFKTKKELDCPNEPNKVIESALPWLMSRTSSGGSHGTLKCQDAQVTASYLNVRQDFESLNVLQSLADVESMAGAIRNKSREPSISDMVLVSEKSSVFTMGLIIVELFGGKRTGLTSLTRLKSVVDIFLNETGNAEFRMVMEWERPNPLLDSSLGANISHPHSRLSHCGSSDHWQSSDTCASESARAVGSKNQFSNLNPVHNTQQIPGRCRGCARKRCSPIPSACFFDLYRHHAYPTEGILAAWNPKGNNRSPQSATADMVLNLLDSCLRFRGEERPSLMELMAELQEIRRVLCFQNQQSNVHSEKVSKKSIMNAEAAVTY